MFFTIEQKYSIMFSQQNQNIIERLQKDIEYLENRLSEMRTTLYGINREINRLEDDRNKNERLRELKDARDDVAQKIRNAREDKYLVVAELKKYQN